MTWNSDFTSRFLRNLGKAPEAASCWTTRWDPRAWTRILTGAVRAAIPRRAYLKVAAKGFSSAEAYGRSEYLTIDVMAYDNKKSGGWSTPVAVVEMENYGLEKCKYCAWKVLSVRADHRVLICNVDTQRQYKSYGYAESRDKLREALRPVVRGTGGQPLLVLAGDWSATPAAGGWSDVFKPILVRSGV